MRAKKDERIVYVSDHDIFLVQKDGDYEVYGKYDGCWLGRAFDEDVEDFMRLQLGLRTWGGDVHNAEMEG